MKKHCKVTGEDVKINMAGSCSENKRKRPWNGVGNIQIEWDDEEHWEGNRVSKLGLITAGWNEENSRKS